MRRKLVTFCSAVSLLLCVAVCVLWVRSYLIPVAYRFQHRGQACEAALTRGRVSVNNAPEVVARAMQRRRSAVVATTMPAAPVPPLWSRSSRAALPLVIAALAVLPMLGCKFWNDGIRRRRAGLCPSCGYDLRATPERCPECGRAASAVGR